MKKVAITAVILALSLFACKKNEEKKVFSTQGVVTKVEVITTGLSAYCISDYCTIKRNGFEKGALIISEACEKEKKYGKREKTVDYTVLFFDRQNLKHEEVLSARRSNNWEPSLQEELPLSEVGKKLSIFTGGAEELRSGCVVRVFYRLNDSGAYLALPVADASMCAKPTPLPALPANLPAEAPEK